MIEVMARYLSPGTWILGISPIATVLVLMVALRWGGAKAGAVAWLWAALVSLTCFGGDVTTLASGTAKGLWETLFILLIVWGAMSVYGLIDGMGGFPVITSTFNRVTGGDRLLQILIIGMVFPAWMQGVLGFGTPVAVTAPLLIGLGFDPILAVTIPLLGHSWTVTFGSLGSSYWTLQRMTGLAEKPLALWSAVYFVPMCVMMFFFGAFWYSKLVYGDPWREVKRGWFPWLSLGVIQGMAIFLFSAYVFPSIGGFMAGFVGLAWGSLIRKFPFYRVEVSDQTVAAQAGTGPAVTAPATKEGQKPASRQLTFGQAFLPYVVIIVLVLAIYLSPLLQPVLGTPNIRAILEQNQFQLGPAWPQTKTALGFVNAKAAKYSPLRIFTMPGSIIWGSLIISVAIYTIAGLFKPQVWKKIGERLIKAAIPASLTLIPLSMMSVVMMEHGITTLLAVGTAKATGALYPFFANYIGQLGAFMTGSNTASNILFGAFQRDTALVLGITPFLVAGAQTVGGAIGNIHCPMNITLGTGSAGIPGREGEVMSRTLTTGAIIGLVTGVLSLVLVSMFPRAGL
ncbi:MAG: L-lactate permease [Firmicutes bacterium]|nr:L-lactate permease [Bacillota bacterium]